MKWTDAEISILRGIFPSASWKLIFTALPDRNRSVINQKARACGLAREVSKRAPWTGAEISALWRLYPASDVADVEAALPGRAFVNIAKKASALGVKRQTLGTRTNKRHIHPLVRQLRAEREAHKMSRKALSKKSGYHINQLLGWELGKTSPDLRYIC